MRSRETLLRLHRFRTEDKRRQVADIDGMIQDFMRKYDELDAQVKFEESRNGCGLSPSFAISWPMRRLRWLKSNRSCGVPSCWSKRKAGRQHP
jgi:flagellar FliJ protein